MGFVYLATNENMSDLVKIGRSENADERVKSLVSSGVPGKYEAKYSCYVRDEVGVEEKMHTMLKHVYHDKEFYKVDWLVAAGILITLALEEEGAGVKPESAKWLRQELLQVSGVQLKKDENVESLPNSADERRIAYMRYIRQNIPYVRASIEEREGISSEKIEELRTERVKASVSYLEFFAKQLGISSMFDITSDKEVENYIESMRFYKKSLTERDRKIRGVCSEFDSKSSGISGALLYYRQFLQNK